MQTYPPGTRIEQYEIASRPMMGGMGMVYFALDHGNDGRPVALKTFRPEFLPDRATRDRFLREGTAWVELGSHPHIVRCYEVKYIDPTAFLVLELIAKEQNKPDASLRAWLIPGYRLPIEQALLFALQIARGMQYATEKIPGFVHRDLKPENILVGADKLSGTNINRLRVTDFGLVKTIADIDAVAKVENTEELKLNQVRFTRGAGTPLYMAPEQWKGEPVGVFTDVYAFGCILHEMLAGQYAVEGKTIHELQISHSKGILDSLPENIPSKVKDITAHCLGLIPSDRYQQWEDLIGTLERADPEQGEVFLPIEPTSKNENQDERRKAGWSYNAIGESYQDMGQAELAASYFEKALTIAQETGDQPGEAYTICNLGLIYSDIGDFHRAIRYHEQHLNLVREMGNRRGEGTALGNIGKAYSELGDIHQAITYSMQALTIARETADHLGEVNALSNLGSLYADINDTTHAIDYYEQCLDLFFQISNPRKEAAVLGNLGSVYADVGNYRRAIWYHERHLAIAREIGDRHGEEYALGNLGIAHKNLGNIPVAIRYYKQAIEIDREIGDMLGLAFDTYNMAILYVQQGEITQALSLARECIQVSTKIGHVELTTRAEQLIAKLHEKDAHTSTNPLEVAFEAFESFQLAESEQEMQISVEKYPFMKSQGFIQSIEESIEHDVPTRLKPSLQQRLSWLRKIANN